MTDTTTSSGSSSAESPMDTFVQMSALLTGFAAAVIAPTLDPTDLKTAIFETAQRNTGKVFDRLLARYVDLVAQIAPGKTVDQMTDAEKREIGTQLLDNDDDQQVTETGRAVIKAWFLGSWYQPFSFGSSSAGTQTVISDQAYIQGLAWKSMQSHAMGNSTWTFGYWADPPPPLTDFTGGNPILDPDSNPVTPADSDGGAS